MSDFVQIIYFKYIFFYSFRIPSGEFSHQTLCVSADRYSVSCIISKSSYFVYCKSLSADGWLLHQFWIFVGSYVGQSVATLG